MNDKLLANVRFYFAQSTFMTNAHYKAYERYGKKKTLISRCVIGVSVITIILLILQIIALSHKNNMLIGFVSYIGLLLSLASVTFELFSKEDLSITQYQHKIFAEKYKSLRDEYMSLIEEIMSTASSEEQLRQKKDTLQKQYSSMGNFAPQTNGIDYVNTQKGLGLPENSSEEFTWADKDIDKLLPERLRLGVHN